MVITHEVADAVAEAAELGQQPVAAVGVLLDRRVLVVVERARLLQDLVGDRELADVVDEPADRERPQAAPRQPELVADLHRAKSDTARVALRVLVLLRERDRQRAHLRAEEQVLGGDELRGGQIARKRPRLRGAREVDRDGDADHENAVELDLVADPPAELLVVHGQRGHERGREPDEADCDGEVEHAPREQERAHRAQRHEPEREHADREQRERIATARRRYRRQQARPDKADMPSARMTASSAASTSRNGRTLRRTRGSGSTENTSTIAPAGSVAPPVIATTPLLPNHTPGVEKPCSASRPAITANAVPTTIVLVSPRRAPIAVSPTAATSAAKALKPTV